MKIKLKRIYEKVVKNDGYRILVDRLWPRGVKKEEAAIDLWLKDIAPSPSLRKWFNHDPQRWPEFQQRYTHELQNKEELLALIQQKSKESQVTLVYAAKDVHHTHALVLLKKLEKFKI